jgi:signal transduction histidine kinase
MNPERNKTFLNRILAVNSEQLLADRVHKLFDHAILGLTATFINGSILALVLWGQVNVQNLMVWLAGVFLVVIIRLSITLSYFKAAPSYNDASKWKNRFCVSLFLSGMLWGSPAIFLFPSSSVGHQVFIAFVAGGMAVGAAATFTSILSAYYLFSVPALLPLVIRFFSVGSEIHIAMGFMILIFFFLMSLLALYTHKDFSRLLVLRYENFDLVDELRQKNRQVEAIVATRTAELKKTVEQLRDEVAARKEAAQARKLVEEQLQALNDDLERRVENRTRELQETQAQYLHAEKLSAVGKLSASIAHEFNNPLQGIKAILKGLKRRAILEEEDKELLDLAISENERMKNLIKSLQDFNRPSAGQKMEMDVHAALDSLLLLYKSDFKRKRISTLRKYAEGFPPITVVPDQFKQVFLNLLNNAMDACSEKGGEITISTCHSNQKVAISIQDTGIGLSDDDRNKIFEPFFTTKAKEKGTGLGLSICQDIIQHHQGEIRVESSPGKGSTFTILLPAF